MKSKFAWLTIISLGILVLSFFVRQANANPITYIYFDISLGPVSFTDETYTGIDLDGNAIEGAHDPLTHYVITQSEEIATTNVITVGTSSVAVTSDFIIYLAGVNIQSTDSSAFSVNTKNPSVVAVILKSETKNYLYSGKNRAGLEKVGGETGNGTLLVTCEKGYEAWLLDENAGHVDEHGHSGCDDTCGALDAKSGNAWYNVSSQETYVAAAGIGTVGSGKNGSSSENTIAGSNALINLTIAGGNIEATGARGQSSSSSSGGAASIGTGSASSSSQIAGTITGLKITGGTIIAYRGDNSAACIGGGYRSGYVNMEIYGGTIDATKESSNLTKTTRVRAAGIGGGGGGTSSASPAGATVNIYGGNISAVGKYGSAIGAGAGGSTGSGASAKINIQGGTIVATTTKGDGNGAGAAIGTGGSLGTGNGGEATINITAGTITASSELGADIGGGGTNSTKTSSVGGKGIINISGGYITALTGGIGGGNANAGIGGDARLTITGGIINAYSISGGDSKTNVGGRAIVNVSDGIVNTGTIGGGVCEDSTTGKIGSAEVEITGGTIRGQIIMDSTNLAEDAQCYFKMSGGTIDNTPNIDESLNFPFSQANGSAVYINGKGNSEEAIAHFSGGTIKNTTGELGGAIYIAGGGSMLMTGGTLELSTATSDGGAVYIDGGDFEMQNGTIKSCSAANDGGAIYLDGGTFKTSGGEIYNNNASNNGGAVYLGGGTFSSDGGHIYNNTATSGGGVFIADGTVNIVSGQIEKNIASAGDGAGVYIGGNGTFIITGGEIKENKAPNGNGGGVYLDSGIYTMEAGNISNNTSLNGGGAYVNSATFTLTGGSFDNNIVTNNGGGFYIGDNSTVSLSNGTISDNKAVNGGGFYQTQNLNKTVTNISGNCIITNNEAANGNGAGVYIDGGSTFRMIGGKVTYNKASTTLRSSIAAKDSTSGVGGGVYILNGTFTMYDEYDNPGTAAIFGNTADVAADDLFASGTNTSFDAISVINMEKADAYKTADSWFEDFPLNESHITLNYNVRIDDDATNDTIVSLGRYKNMTDKDDMVIATTVLYRNCTDYIAITMGNSVGKIKISVNGDNTITAHSFIFKFESCSNEECNDTNPEIVLEVVAQKKKDAIVVDIPTGLYKVSIVPTWSWRYNENINFDVTENSIKKDRVTGNSVNINVYSEQFTNIDTSYLILDKQWLAQSSIVQQII